MKNLKKIKQDQSVKVIKKDTLKKVKGGALTSVITPDEPVL